MRAINEDDVKRLIRSEKRNWVLTQFPGVTEALNHVEGGLVGIRTVESPIPRWIPVKEKLPEDGKNVLVHVTNPAGWWNVDVDWRTEGGWAVNADSDWHIVTHWMPMPEPPEEPA